jgi:hypothetical protein
MNPRWRRSLRTLRIRRSLGQIALVVTKSNERKAPLRNFDCSNAPATIAPMHSNETPAVELLTFKIWHRGDEVTRIESCVMKWHGRAPLGTSLTTAADPFLSTYGVSSGAGLWPTPAAESVEHD